MSRCAAGMSERECPLLGAEAQPVMDARAKPHCLAGFNMDRNSFCQDRPMVCIRRAPVQRLHGSSMLAC